MYITALNQLPILGGIRFCVLFRCIETQPPCFWFRERDQGLVHYLFGYYFAEANLQDANLLRMKIDPGAFQFASLTTYQLVYTRLLKSRLRPHDLDRLETRREALDTLNLRDYVYCNLDMGVKILTIIRLLPDVAVAAKVGSSKRCRKMVAG